MNSANPGFSDLLPFDGCRQTPGYRRRSAMMPLLVTQDPGLPALPGYPPY
jgi:hypothetical protein